MKQILILLFFLNSSLSLANSIGTIKTQEFSTIEDIYFDLLKEQSPKDILVVFDIDNTLMKFSKDFGTEHWYLWQKDLIEQGVEGLPAVAASIAELLNVQSLIYQKYPMQMVQEHQARWISDLKKQGSAIITLSSRGLEIAGPTAREVLRNHIELSENEDLGWPESEQTIFLPYDLNNPSHSGLTDLDLAEFKLGPARQAYFKNGVFLTQGQHKGIMLKTFLHKAKRKFKSIIFVDDRENHIINMVKTAENMSQGIWSVHFSLSQTWTIPFQISDKTEAQRDWCEFAKTQTQIQERYRCK